MVDEKNDGWSKTLNDAGLLDDIEDDWEVDGEINSDTVIEVERKNGKKIPLSGTPPTTSTAPTPSPPKIEKSHPYNITTSGEKKFRASEIPWARISTEPDPPDYLDESSFVDIIDEPPRSEIPEPDGSANINRVSEIENLSKMTESYEMGDYSGSLGIAMRILSKNENNKEAVKYRDMCREVLAQMYESRIGSFDRVPKLAIDPQDVIWRNLDPTAGFILSRIDGIMSFNDIIDISAMPRFETCLILSRLLEEEIIK